MNEEQEFLCALKDLTKDEETPPKKSTFVDVNLFTSTKENKVFEDSSISVIHHNEEDVEEIQDFNECGKEIQRLLICKQDDEKQQRIEKKPQENLFPIKAYKLPITSIEDVYIDPFFYMKIIKPQITTEILNQRMQNRLALRFSELPRQIQIGDLKNKDFVICGVLISKSSKTSQQGGKYSIWTLTDLKGDIKTVNLFLFNSAHSDLWKTLIGTVVGVLNPKIMEKKQNYKEIATLSIDTSQKVMIFGDSKDFGKCKSTKNNGEKCNQIVNLSSCEFCVYHVKKEYQKSSKRSELQSNFVGKGLEDLRKKMAGNNDVFINNSYKTILAKKSKELEIKEENILKNLNGIGHNNNVKEDAKYKTEMKKMAIKKSKKNSAKTLDVNPAQRENDLKLLKKLSEENSSETVMKSHEGEFFNHNRENALSLISKLKSKNDEKIQNYSIKLNKSDYVDLSKPVVTRKLVNKAKLNAINYIKEFGPIKKSDPNSVKKSPNNISINTTIINRKRKFEENNVEADADKEITFNGKKTKLHESEFISDRFKKMMAKCSINANLLEIHDNEEKEKYFKKMEIRESMEEKMSNTFKIKCKAVRCVQCNYTNFSASDLCKKERHTLKVFDATKRFFKCIGCNNRTCTLDLIPLNFCKNCGANRWEKCGMMKEKLAKNDNPLSIRGDEQKFINSNNTNNCANLNLLVP